MDLLIEDAELVADPVSDGWTLEGGQRVQVAGGQPAEPTIAQAGLLLAGQHFVDVLAESGQCGAGLLLDLQVEQVVAQMGPEEELRREVGGHLSAQIDVGLGGRGPPVLHPVADRQRQRVVVVLGLQQGGRSAQGVAEMILDRLAQRLRTHPCPGVLRLGSDDIAHSALPRM